MNSTHDKNKLKLSKYAFIEETEKGSFIIYSTMSGAVLLCDRSEYVDQIKSIKDSRTLTCGDKNEVVDILCSKMILLEDDFDEDLYVRSLCEDKIIRSRTLELMLIVTRNCNFNCVYCGQNHENKNMSKEVYDSVLKCIEVVITKREYSSLSITFFGGEPLLSFGDIVMFLRQLKLLSIKYDFTFTSGMTTNAYLLTPDRFNELVENGCTDFQITLDGMSSTHDQTRILKNNNPTWGIIVDNLKYMVSTDHAFRVTLRTNFNMEILNGLGDFYDFVKANFDDNRFQIYFETIKDHGNENTPDTLNGVEELISDISIAKMLKDRGLRTSNIFLKPCNLVCGASNPNFFVVDTDGTLKKCSHLLDVIDNAVGHITSDGDLVIDNGILNSKWVFNDYLSISECKDCRLVPLCFGKRCPIDIVKDCFRCNKVIREASIIEKLKQFC